jgi:hypothetical protein
MESLVRHGTRSKGMINTVIPTGSKVPMAVQQLKTADDWNFKPSGCKLPAFDDPPESSSLDESLDSNTSDEEETDEDTKEAAESYWRFIGDTGGIRELFSESAVCSNCKKGKLVVTFDSKCLHTTIHTRCENCQAQSATPTITTGMTGKLPLVPGTLRML